MDEQSALLRADPTQVASAQPPAGETAPPAPRPVTHPQDPADAPEPRRPGRWWLNRGCGPGYLMPSCPYR